MMKYLIYARVSPRGDQEKETSIQMQIDMCKEYIFAHGGEVIQILSDEFYSGKDMNRPAFKQIMAELVNGQAEWDCICVYKLSRLTRSLRDGANIFDFLYKHAKGFVSITERNLDFSTPSGRAMLGILQVFNQFEREQIAENTRNKMISIAKKGLWPTGKPPFGYKRGVKGDNKLYVDHRKAEVLLDIFNMYASEQFTSMAIIKKHKKYIPSRQKLMNILRSRIPTGVIEYAGHIYPGQHEAIISAELYKKVQESIPQGKRPSQVGCRHSYILSGLVRCHCGRFMTPASGKSGQYHYYQCTDSIYCKNRINAVKLEKNALRQIQGFNVSPEALASAIEEIEILHEKYFSDKQPELDAAIIAKREACQEQEKLYNALISGKLSDSALDFFNMRFAGLEKEIANLNARIEYLQAQCVDDDQVKNDALNIISQMRYFADAMKLAPDDPDVQRRLLLANIKKIQALENGDFKFEFTFSSPERQEWGG